MEPSTSTDHQSQSLVRVDAICYDEELEETVTFQVLGNRPCVKINLEHIHYLTFAFNSTKDVVTTYTENELSTLIAAMKPYVGIKLEFMNNSKVTRINYTPCSLNLINVHKYDEVAVSLCSWEEMSQYFGKITNEFFSSDEDDDDNDNDESSDYVSGSDVTSESEETYEEEEVE